MSTKWSRPHLRVVGVECYGYTMNVKEETVSPEAVRHNDTLTFTTGERGRVFSIKPMDNGTILFTCANYAGSFFTIAAQKGDKVTRRVVEF